MSCSHFYKFRLLLARLLYSVTSFLHIGEGDGTQKLKLGCRKEWQEWSKSGMRPPGMPGNPYKMYRGDGWISWPDWFGSGGRVYTSSMLPSPPEPHVECKYVSACCPSLMRNVECRNQLVEM